MKVNLQSKLQKLKVNYHQATGRSFAHFYCPILFKDEDVELCKAHIVNQAFRKSSRAWTVQRKDVDNFYGGIFEPEFLALQDFEKWSPGEILANKRLRGTFTPKILLDNEPVDYFFVHNTVPENYTRIKIDDSVPVELCLKMPSQSVIDSQDRHWEFEVAKDIRIAALISLIKAAHLTLFEIFGYKYGLSAAGHFVGRQILGEFYLQNFDKSKAQVLQNAQPFFRQFTHMVRPIIADALNLKGTITDHQIVICWDSGVPWARIIFVKVANKLHGVMVPILKNPESVVKFLRFLQDSNASLTTTLHRFEQGELKIVRELFQLNWPKDVTLYPD